MKQPYRVSLEIKDPTQVRFEHQLEYTNFRGDKFTHDFCMEPLAEQTLERLNKWVKQKPDNCEREDLELLGLHLYNVLFPPGSEPRKEFEKDLRFVKNQQSDSESSREGERLRLTIVFPENAEKLAAYPWEFLCWSAGPRQNLFLVAQETRLILTRFVPTTDERSKKFRDETDEKLRILIAFAAPKELGMLVAEGGSGIDDPNTLIGHLQDLQRESPRTIEVRVLEKVTLKMLQDHLKGPGKGYAPHVVHFIGHGRPGALAVMKTEEELKELKTKRAVTGEKYEEAHWLNAITVSDLFVSWKPRLVFLSACDSAASRGSSTESLKGMTDVASYIIRKEIPAVIAMQYPIDNSDAALFARTFYQKLSAGWDIDEAVKEGRSALGKLTTRGQTFEDRRFATPVVYLETEAAIIRPPKPPEEGDSATTAQAPKGKVNCPNPQCLGYVSAGDAFCLACKQPLAECPECHCPILKTASPACGKCGWGLSRPSVTTAAAAAGTEATGAVSGGAQTAFSNAVASTQPGAQSPLQDPRLRYQ